MGRAKQQMMDDQNNGELVEFLTELFEQDTLFGAIEGITKQILGKGIDSISEKQRAAIDGFVEKYIDDIECETCSNGNVGALTDYNYINENGICPTCEYDREKYMKD